VAEDVSRLQNLLEHFSLPTTQNDFSLDNLYDHLKKDKKFSHNVMTFVLPKSIGSVELNSSVQEEDLKGLWT
jgi:3-dehydroquinate synthetase